MSNSSTRTVWLSLIILTTVWVGGQSYEWGHGWGQVQAQDSGSQRKRVTTHENRLEEESRKRIREGQRVVGKIGRFNSGGDRVVFESGELKLNVLENLNLERIAAVVDLDSTATWLVNGTITEFRGQNYLLVTKVILKDKHRGRP